ncbi:MFS transporter [miscellaneous Crenarchaeota group archaeon SMTZ-80]|nr:MAG: MFS transporter [miscellaneous Crenarchaeota group archaeon SMTZ-80]
MDKNEDNKFVLLIASIASFLTSFMGSAVNVALPSISIEFEIDAILLSWVATSYLLSSAIFLVPFGRLADIYGRKRIFLYGILIHTASSYLAAISTSPMILIFFRIIQGIGVAMIFGTSMAILTSIFTVGERGKALGITIAAVYFGLSTGPFLGGFLTQNLGWRSIFLINVPLGLFVIILIFWKLKGEWAEAKGESFDIVGSIIFGLTLAAVMYGFSLLPEIKGTLLILISGVGLYSFIKWEAYVKNPILNLNLFKNNILFTFSNLAALINYSATFAVAFLLSLYLQYIKGLSPQNAGIILISQPIVQAIFSPLAGRLSDKIEPRLIASLGMSITVIGLILLSFIAEKTSLTFIVMCLIILGFSFALFSSPNANAIMSSVEKKFYGVASAILGSMRLIGQMFSMGIAMIVFALKIGRIQITPEYFTHFLTSTKTTLVIFAILCVLGTFASMGRGKIR